MSLQAHYITELQNFDKTKFYLESDENNVTIGFITFGLCCFTVY